MSSTSLGKDFYYFLQKHIVYLKTKVGMGKEMYSIFSPLLSGLTCVVASRLQETLTTWYSSLCVVPSISDGSTVELCNQEDFVDMMKYAFWD